MSNLDCCLRWKRWKVWSVQVKMAVFCPCLGCSPSSQKYSATFWRFSTGMSLWDEDILWLHARIVEKHSARITKFSDLLVLGTVITNWNGTFWLECFAAAFGPWGSLSPCCFISGQDECPWDDCVNFRSCETVFNLLIKVKLSCSKSA